MTPNEMIKGHAALRFIFHPPFPNVDRQLALSRFNRFP